MPTEALRINTEIKEKMYEIHTTDNITICQFFVAILKY